MRKIELTIFGIMGAVILTLVSMRFDPVARGFAATLVNLTNQVTGILPVANGGTGDATLTAHTALVGEGTSAVVGVGPGTSGYPLLGQGASADPAFKQPRGNTQVVQMADSTTNPPTGDLAVFDVNGNVKDGGAPSGGGGISLDITHTSGIYTPVDPPTSGWSWVNQGTATIATNGSALCLHIPDTGSSLQWRLYMRTITPSTYTIVAHFALLAFAQNSQTGGIYLYDSVSGKATGMEYLLQAPAAGGDPGVLTWRVQRLNSVTSAGTTPAQIGFSGGPFTIGSFKIVEDGTNRTYYWSRDRGLNWYQLLQEPTGTFITPNEAGFGGFSVTSSVAPFVDVDLLSWTGI
ncbi:MAG TPA: hypothetical protein VND65_06925 [Candidatus Binatia bacterium]|nr:hypothetical protein [Candidatus Binatia bacterium]